MEYPSAITSKWSYDLEKAGLCCTGQETYGDFKIGFEINNYSFRYYNSGLFYLRSSLPSLRFIEQMRSKEDVGLQEALNLAVQL